MDKVIKFRGKRIDTGGWVYGDLLHEGHHGEIFIRDHSGRGWYDREVDPDTVGEYINLADKDGKEIYEGDIIQMYSASPSNHLGRVRQYVVAWQPLRNKVGWNIGAGASAAFREVIGNIHDNPIMAEIIREKATQQALQMTVVGKPE